MKRPPKSPMSSSVAPASPSPSASVAPASPSPSAYASSASSASSGLPAAAEPPLHGQRIVYRRAQATILDGVDLSLARGEVVSLLGVNGAGKSTLLRIMLGLLRPDSGEVSLDGKPLSQYRRRDIALRVAYVPQSHTATFAYTAQQIVALGRVPHVGIGGRLRRLDREAVDSAMARLQVAHLATRPYTALSGGERQRVLLARAVAQGAALLVLDEPLTGLDYGQQLRTIRLLSDLAADGYGVLQTTHHPEHALSGATRAVLLEHGRIVADGPPRSVIDSRSMAALYDIPLAQIDIAEHRFLVAADRPDTAERNGPDETDLDN